jgi:phage gp37-like protein
LTIDYVPKQGRNLDMAFHTRAVMLLDGDLSWCQEVTIRLSAEHIASRWGSTPACVQRLSESTRFDAVLLDVDTLGAGTARVLVRDLVCSTPAPVVVAWGGSLDASAGFALGRLGVRLLLARRPRPSEVMDVLTHALSTPPTFEPQIRGLVGHFSLGRVVGTVRHLLAEQALGLKFDNRTHAAELLHVSRQAVQQLLRRHPSVRPKKRSPRASPVSRVRRAG